MLAFPPVAPPAPVVARVPVATFVAEDSVRWMLGLVVALLLLGSSSVPAPAGAAAREPVLLLPERPVTATPDFRWRFMIRILNPLEFGLFVDSMWVEVADLDPGVTGNPKQFRLPMNMLARQRSAISGGDSLLFAYSGNALCESAALTIHMHAHTGTGKRYTRSGKVEIRPAQQSRQIASEKIVVAGRSIELLRLNGTGGSANLGPGVVIVHGDGMHARRLIPTATSIVSLGFSAVLVSLPGYGQSAGPAEFAGPATVAAIEAALDTLRAMSGVDSNRIGLWGIGQGASAAAFVAARQPGLAALVLTAGIYDPEAILASGRPGKLPDLIRREAGADASARRGRSPLERASALAMPVLLVHSQLDSVATIAQAHAFAAAIRSNGGKVDVVEDLDAGRFSASDADTRPEAAFLRDRVQMKGMLGP